MILKDLDLNCKIIEFHFSNGGIKSYLNSVLLAVVTRMCLSWIKPQLQMTL